MGETSFCGTEGPGGGGSGGFCDAQRTKSRSYQYIVESTRGHGSI